jgi:hypothetical protein
LNCLVNNLLHFFYKFFIFFSQGVDNTNMNGVDVNEIGAALGIRPKTAKMRLLRAGIQPIGKSGPTAIYNPSVIELIREVSRGGRPRKAPK